MARHRHEPRPKMAYAHDILNPAGKTGLIDRLNAARATFAKYRARRRVFAATVRELSALSDRELADLGLSRCDIRGLAQRAARETVA